MADQETTANENQRDYRDTLFLPKTEFPMRAGLPKADGAVLVPGDCETIAAGGLVEFVPFFQD